MSEVETTVWVEQAFVEGSICGRLRAEGHRYTRSAPSHFGPMRKAAWLRGYDAALKEEFMKAAIREENL